MILKAPLQICVMVLLMALINLCPCFPLAHHTTIVCFYCLCIPSFRKLKFAQRTVFHLFSHVFNALTGTVSSVFVKILMNFVTMSPPTSLLREHVYYNKEGFIYPHNKPRITKDQKWSSTKRNRLFTQVIFLRRRLSY